LDEIPTTNRTDTSSERSTQRNVIRCGLKNKQNTGGFSLSM
jgi:hypothetical protein